MKSNGRGITQSTREQLKKPLEETAQENTHS